MLQWLYTYVASVYLDVAYVSHIYYKYFILMLRKFVMVSGVFANVSDACFKCFIWIF
jgi:hypothetical protein